MTEEEKDKLVEEVMNGFDFQKAHSIMYLTNKYYVPSLAGLQEQARKKLRMALDHQDREFWWAGGLNGRGGLCACYDDIWGLSLNYIVVANRVRIQKDDE